LEAERSPEWNATMTNMAQQLDVVQLKARLA